MGGVGSLAIIFGVSTAWLVSRYHFAGRGWFEWVLVMPAAMPAYIIAYSYTDFFEYAGPFQGYLRAFLAGRLRVITGFPKFGLLAGRC